MTAERVSQSFGKHRRLRKKPQFDAVFAQNRSRADSRLVVYLTAQEDDTAPTRLGLVVGKRNGHSPARSRIKRLLREAFRQLRHDLPAGLDVVVLPRPEAVRDYSLKNLQESLRSLVRLPVPDPRPPRPRGKRRKK